VPIGLGMAYRPLAARWNAAQSGGLNNRFQLPREKKIFCFALQIGLVDVTMLGVYCPMTTLFEIAIFAISNNPNANYSRKPQRQMVEYRITDVDYATARNCGLQFNSIINILEYSSVTSQKTFS